MRRISALVQPTVSKPNHRSLDTQGLFVILVAALSILHSIQTYAQIEENVIRHAVPTGFKKLYPAADGIIWTETFLKEIFEDSGFSIHVIEGPAKRLDSMLLNNQIDTLLTSATSFAIGEENILESKYPGTSLAMYVYYNINQDWQPSWPPQNIFKDKKGKSKQSSKFLHEDHGLNISQSSSFDACIKMVNAGRADYWLDNITGYTNATPGLMKLRTNEFTYKELFRIPIYIFFHNDKRGKQLKKIYDEGIERILKNGDYIVTYYKYDTTTTSTKEGDLAVEQIKSMFPNLPIPKQKPRELDIQ